MKKLNKYLLLLAAALFTFTACEKDIQREPSQPFEGKAVFFPISAESEELEPTAVLEHAIKIQRDTINNEELKVKLLVVSNTQDIFEVPDSVTFEAGVTETSFLVKFPNAQIDSTYTLSIQLEDANSNPYLTLKPSYSYTVNIAKWDLVTDKKAIVFDGIVNVFFGTGTPGWYVPYARKDNADGSFDIRLLNPYTVLPDYDMTKEEWYKYPVADKFGLYKGFPDNYPEDVDSEGTYNMTIHVSKKGEATFDTFAMGMTWSYGAFFGAHSTAKGMGKWDKDTLSITFPAGSVACAMANYNDGAFYLGSEKMVIYLDDALWQDIHSAIKVADLEDGFNDASLTWNDIDAELSTVVSTILPEPGLIDVKLQNCVDPNPESKQGPGSDFYNLYRLTDVYAADFGLAFYWDTLKSKITLPIAPQPTGLVFGGKQILVGASAEHESFIEETVLGGKDALLFHFFLQVQTADGGNLGEYEEVYYFSKEKIIWGEKASDFVNTYSLTGFSPFDGSDVQMDVAIVEEEGKLFLVGIDYCSGIALDFDDEAKTISFVPQDQDSLYGKYDIAVYTMTAEGDASATDAVVLEMKFGGKLSLTDDSPAIGFLTRSEAAGGWLDGAYDIAFTPAAPAKAAPAKAISVKNSNIAVRKHATVATKMADFKYQGKLPKHNFFFKQK